MILVNVSPVHDVSKKPIRRDKKGATPKTVTIATGSDEKRILFSSSDIDDRTERHHPPLHDFVFGWDS